MFCFLFIKKEKNPIIIYFRFKLKLPFIDQTQQTPLTKSFTSHTIVKQASFKLDRNKIKLTKTVSVCLSTVPTSIDSSFGRNKP